MEKEDCLPHSPGAILMSPIRLRKSYYSYNLVIHSIIQVWKHVAKQLKLRALSFTNISKSDICYCSTVNGSFDQWKDLGLRCVGNLYIWGMFASWAAEREEQIFWGTFTLSILWGHIYITLRSQNLTCWTSASDIVLWKDADFVHTWYIAGNPSNRYGQYKKGVRERIRDRHSRGHLG